MFENEDYQCACHSRTDIMTNLLQTEMNTLFLSHNSRILIAKCLSHVMQVHLLLMRDCYTLLSIHIPSTVFIASLYSRHYL